MRVHRLGRLLFTIKQHTSTADHCVALTTIAMEYGQPCLYPDGPLVRRITSLDSRFRVATDGRARRPDAAPAQLRAARRRGGAGIELVLS